MSKRKIGILSIGAGNLFSIISALKELNLDYNLIKNRNELASVDVLILPGVGAFNSCMEKLNSQHFGDEIKEFASNTNNCVLGICVGMQILFNVGYENGVSEGLGIFEGEVKKNILGLNIGYKLFQSKKKSNNGEFSGSVLENKFYFTHGYKVLTKYKFSERYDVSVGNENICGFIRKNNVIGCQFHPELSGDYGKNLLWSILNG